MAGLNYDWTKDVTAPAPKPPTYSTGVGTVSGSYTKTYNESRTNAIRAAEQGYYTGGSSGSAARAALPSILEGIELDRKAAELTYNANIRDYNEDLARLALSLERGLRDIAEQRESTMLDRTEGLRQLAIQREATLMDQRYGLETLANQEAIALQGLNIGTERVGLQKQDYLRQQMAGMRDLALDESYLTGQYGRGMEGLNLEQARVELERRLGLENTDLRRQENALQGTTGNANLELEREKTLFNQQVGLREIGQAEEAAMEQNESSSLQRGIFNSGIHEKNIQRIDRDAGEAESDLNAQTGFTLRGLDIQQEHLNESISLVGQRLDLAEEQIREVAQLDLRSIDLSREDLTANFNNAITKISNAREDLQYATDYAFQQLDLTLKDLQERTALERRQIGINTDQLNAETALDLKNLQGLEGALTSRIQQTLDGLTNAINDLKADNKLDTIDVQQQIKDLEAQFAITQQQLDLRVEAAKKSAANAGSSGTYVGGGISYQEAQEIQNTYYNADTLSRLAKEQETISTTRSPTLTPGQTGAR